MTTREKLQLMDEIDERNAARERAHAEAEHAARMAAVHRSIEIYARSILEGMDVLARHHGVNRAELLELLMNTAWAMEQTRAQDETTKEGF